MALTRDKLLQFLDEEMYVDTSELEDDTPLFSSNLLDSFNVVELIAFIEKEAGSKIVPTDVKLDNLDTVEAIFKLVEHYSQS